MDTLSPDHLALILEIEYLQLSLKIAAMEGAGSNYFHQLMVQKSNGGSCSFHSETDLTQIPTQG